MTEDDFDDNDLRALRERPQRKVGGNTVRSRIAGERKSAHLDGRRSRVAPATRETPLNVDLPHEVKALVVKARAEFGVTMKQFVSEAIRAHYRALEITAQSQEDPDADRSLPPK